MSRKRKPSNKRAVANTVRLEFITKWYNYYRFDKVWNCPHCQTQSGYFKSIECENPDLITWNLTCNSCTKEFILKMDFKRLLKIQVNYNRTIDRTNITEIGECYRIWMTAMDYPEFLRNAEDEDNYKIICEKLRVQSQGKMKFFNRVKKVWQRCL
jgi:transcription elongation factor Elf1